MTASLPVQPPTSAPAGAVRTHCPYCAFQCGMLLTPSPVPSIQADPKFPVNRGQMCIKGFNSGALLTSGQRITTPLVRDAAGNMREASWDEALGFVIERFRELRERLGADALGAYGSGALTNEKAYLLGKLVRVGFGSSQIDYNGRYCMASAAAGQNRAFGIDRGLPFPVSDLAETDCLLLWGSNCADTMPPIMQYVHAQRERGGKRIVVDPRATETARNADLHLQLTPGSDLALSNGLLALAIDRGLVDVAYIAERTTGFERLRRALSSYEPARVERLTGISLDDMRRALDLMTAGSSMLLSGRGPEQQSKGSDTVASFANLMLALGRVGKPASGYGCLTGQGNGQGGREHGQKADQLPGYRSILDPDARAHLAEIWGVKPEQLPGKGKSTVEMIDAMGRPGGLAGFIVFGSNLVVASPHSSHVEERLRSLDTLVVCDSFWNDTAELCHVFLPVLQWAEEGGTVTNLEGRVIRRRPAVAPPSGPRSDLSIMSALGSALGDSAQFAETESEALFAELCRATQGGKADYSGLSYELLDERQGVHWPCNAAAPEGTPRLFAERFYHPDGKAHFSVVHHRAAGEEPDEDYPLYFTTGRYKEHYNSGAQTRRVDTLMDAKPEPKLEMHARLAEALGVSDGERVVVESRRGQVILRAVVGRSIRPDTVFAPFHWGGRMAANLLTNPALDPVSRMPEFKICAVRVRRWVEEGVAS
ncbi:MAG TPA: molybdopterin oxidoreductase family protein [Polyangiaceae bacterium]|nr:molybdopterin oxidoreductase family protein [Polyangiaceae bacterium]